jgi:hypothetical protein
MHKALVILTSALGSLASLAAIVAFPAGVFLLWQLDRTLHADSYRPATFTVAWVAYRPSGRRTSPDYWAMGTIDGHRERFGLGGVLNRVSGWDDLEAQVHPGQEIKVLYDPSFDKQGDAGRQRVIAYEDDFAARQKGRFVRLAGLIYGPCLVLLGASVALGLSIRRPPVTTTLLTLFFLVGGAAGVALIRTVMVLSSPGRAGMLQSGPGRLVMEGLGALSCPGTVLGVGALAWFLLRQKKKRANALRLRAPALGLEFLGNAPDADADIAELGPFALLRGGIRRYVENRMRGSRDGYDVRVFDYGYTASSDDTSTWRTVVRIASPALRLPAFTLEPRTLIEDLGEAFGVIQPVDFEGHARFSQDYLLRGPEPDAVRAAVGEPALAFFETSGGWSVESLGDRLLVSRENATVPPERIDAFLADVLGLVRTLVARPS